jgi:hypothetical protein
MKVDVTDLKSEDRDVIEELVELLGKRTEAGVETGTDEVLVKGKKEGSSRRHVRVLLRKFLHKQDLKRLSRVMGGRESS